MVGIKTFFNNQWGQASADGNAAAPADVAPVGVGDGIAPLVDQYGRPYVHVVSGGGGGGMEVTVVPEVPPTNLPKRIQNSQTFSVTDIGSANPTKVYNFQVWTKSNVEMWACAFDLAVAPVVGNQATVSWPIPSAADHRLLDLSFQMGLFFFNGLYIAVSNNPNTFQTAGVTNTDFGYVLLYSGGT